MSRRRDREFWDRLAEQMRADEAEFEAKWEAATRRKQARLAARRRGQGEREPHTVPIVWKSVSCAVPTSTSGTAAQVLGVAAPTSAPPRRKRWRWF